jgi:hypothetical protein
MASSSRPVGPAVRHDHQPEIRQVQQALTGLALDKINQMVVDLSGQSSARSVSQRSLPGDEKIQKVVSHLSPELLSGLAQTELARCAVRQAAESGVAIKLSDLLKEYPGARLQLADLKCDPPLLIEVGDTQMRLQIEATSIGQRDNIDSQLKDPLYRNALLQHTDTQHFAVRLQDLLKEEPAELQEARANLAALQQEPYADDEELMMAQIIVQSLEETFEKPSISLRFAEDGSIAEVRSIETQSKFCRGSQLMETVNELQDLTGTRQLFLEDDATIGTGETRYSLRLLRLLGTPSKSSWYEDSCQYKPYSQTAQGLQASDQTSREHLRDQVDLLRRLPLRDLIQELSNARTYPSSSLDVLHELVKDQPTLTWSEAIEQQGAQRDAHTTMKALLDDAVNSLARSVTDSPLQRAATAILDSKFFVRQSQQ